MRERKYVKLRSDMYDDTKFKIIDTMENRDTINYIWTRILTLCGKINNSFGYLLLSKNMIYTIELLSIEFNRSKEQVEEAVNVFIDLKMMTREENGMLKVCNWSKHQGCKDKNTENTNAERAQDKETKEVNIKDENSIKKQDDKIEQLNAEEVKEEKRENRITSDKEAKLINIRDVSKDKKKRSTLTYAAGSINDTNSIGDKDKKELIEDKVKLKEGKKKRKRKIETINLGDEECIEEELCGVVEDENINFGNVIKTFDVN